MMLIVGLTGSMGMGKSTAAERFRQLGIPVFDADAEVHQLYAGALSGAIEAAFPGTTSGGVVDRKLLSAALIAQPWKFVELESLVHPAVRAAQERFLKTHADRGAKMAVLEIPLFFEGGGECQVDAAVVVSADAATQRRRLHERPGMTAEKIEQLLGRQMPDADKRARADFVIDTSGTDASCHRQVDDVAARLADWRQSAYGRYWSK